MKLLSFNGNVLSKGRHRKILEKRALPLFSEVNALCSFDFKEESYK